jgi:hypothetical protein
VFHKQAWHSQPTVEQHIVNAPETSDFCCCCCWNAQGLLKGRRVSRSQSLL